MLKAKWTASMSWQEIIRLRDNLDKALQEMRTTRNIQPPIMSCPKCKAWHRSAPPKISVRAMILALGRFNIEEGEIVRTIEKAWKAYQAKNMLDLYGKPKNGITNKVRW